MNASRKCKLITVGSAFLLSTCTIISPSLQSPRLNQTATSSDIYQNVVNDARSVEAQLQQRIEEIDEFDFWSGVGLLGVGITGVAFGAYHASRDASIGAGIAGASLLGLRSLVPISVRRGIYVQGIAALECSITATTFPSGTVPPSSTTAPQPAGAETGGPPTGVVASVAGGLAALQPALTGGLTANNEVAASLDGIQAELSSRAVGRAAGAGTLAGLKAAELAASVRQTNQAVQDALNAAQTAETARAARLESAVEGVVIAVNAQLASNSLNPMAALTAAQQGVSSLETSAKNAAQQALNAANNQQQKAQETSSVAKQAATAAANQNQPTVQAAAQKLEQTANQAQGVATQVKGILQQLLSTANIPTACFGGLIAG
jgi:hypothetical protein